MTVTSSDVGEVSVSDNLSFASSDWWIDQTVTVTGVDDNVSDDNQTTLLTLSLSSGDDKYDNNSLSLKTVATTTDNDSATLVSQRRRQ